MSARVGDLRYECKYINVRRWLMCLEHFIDKGERWAVFENKGAGSDGREPDSVDSVPGEVHRSLQAHRSILLEASIPI